MGRDYHSNYQRVFVVLRFFRFQNFCLLVHAICSISFVDRTQTEIVQRTRIAQQQSYY